MRWCLRVYGDCPTGAAWCGTGLMADSRGAGAVVGRGARTHLTSFSFRAFRFATRYRGGRGGLYQRADVGIRPYGRTMAFRVPVGADVFIGPLQKPHQPPSQRQRKAAQGVSQTSPGPPPPAAGGLRLRRPTRRSVFSLWTVHGPFLFLQDQKRNGGCIPARHAPCGSRNPPRPPNGGPNPLHGHRPPKIFPFCENKALLQIL